MKKTTIAVGLLGAASLIGVAVAQTITVPTRPNVGATDLIQIQPGGAPSGTNVYVLPKQITAQYGYYKSSPATGFTYTFGANVTKAIFVMTTTFSTGSVTLTATPNDGQEDCFFTTNIITTLTVAANTGQSIVNNAAAATAAGHQCYLYSLSNATWNRSE